MLKLLGRNPIGVPLDPEDIAQKYRAPVAEAELRRFESSSGLDSEMLRRVVE